MDFRETAPPPDVDQLASETPPTKKETAKVPSVEYEGVPVEIKEFATNEGIRLMREALAEIKNYAVFASTAMYLYGHQYGIKELQAIPGDFDGVVKDESTLKQVRERLDKIPGLVFDRGGRFGVIKRDQARILSGNVYLETGNPEVPIIKYPFEFFTVDTKIIPPDVFHKRRELHGVQVLSLEGLQNQYLNNLSFESRLAGRVSDMVIYLTRPDVREREARTQAVLEHLQISEKSLDAFYRRYDKLIEAGIAEEQVLSDPGITRILSGGYKTKVPKRIQNIEALKGLQQIS